jgi:predicted metal-dependent hydrolase
MQNNESQFPITITRKNVKNLRITVTPPDGRVTVSAPLKMSEKDILTFIQDKKDWIIKCREKQLKAPKKAAKEYMSGEIIYIFGKPYTLQVTVSDKKESMYITSDTAVLLAKSDGTAETRKKIIDKKLREMLQAEIEKRLPLWEQKTGLKCNKFSIKAMKTRWGSYSTKTKAIAFSDLLACKPIECLEYVIVHELGHVKYPNHGKGFKNFLTAYLPDWKKTKKLLNEFNID